MDPGSFPTREHLQCWLLRAEALTCFSDPPCEFGQLLGWSCANAPSLLLLDRTRPIYEEVCHRLSMETTAMACAHVMVYNEDRSSPLKAVILSFPLSCGLYLPCLGPLQAKKDASPCGTCLPGHLVSCGYTRSDCAPRCHLHSRSCPSCYEREHRYRMRSTPQRRRQRYNSGARPPTSSWDRKLDPGLQ